MLETLVALYLLITILNLKYIKRDKLPEKTELIVVLSASRDDVTLSRLRTTIRLIENYPNATIAICGKEKANLMKNFLKTKKFNKVLIQNKSTNTYEDALYLKSMLHKKEKANFILVTSSAHQKRAYNTFKRVFKNTIWNYPTSDIFSFYSPLLPTGWVINSINAFKDKKHNNKWL